MADGFEEGTRRVDVDAHAEVEVGFGAGGHDAVEDVGGIEGGVDNAVGIGAEIDLEGLDVLRVFRAPGDGDVDDIRED